MNQTNNRIREEWRGNLNTALEIFKGPDAVSKKQIIMLVESFISELLKSQREELVEKIKKHQNFITMSDYDVGYNDCKENIINLIHPIRVKENEE